MTRIELFGVAALMFPLICYYCREGWIHGGMVYFICMLALVRCALSDEEWNRR